MNRYCPNIWMLTRFDLFYDANPIWVIFRLYMILFIYNDIYGPEFFIDRNDEHYSNVLLSRFYELEIQLLEVLHSKHLLEAMEEIG